MATEKKGKSKGTTISLQQFLDKDPSNYVRVTGAETAASINWAEETVDDGPPVSAHENSYTSAWTFNRHSLPTEPRSKRAIQIDEGRIPSQPPYKAFVGNLPFEAAVEDLQGFFKNPKITDVHFVKNNGRPRGFAYVEFTTREELIEAMAMDGEKLNGRPLRVDVGESGAGHEGRSNQGMQRGGERGDRSSRFGDRDERDQRERPVAPEDSCWRRAETLPKSSDAFQGRSNMRSSQLDRPMSREPRDSTGEFRDFRSSRDSGARETRDQRGGFPDRGDRPERRSFQHFGSNGGSADQAPPVDREIRRSDWTRPPRTDSNVNREDHASDQPPAANREIRRSDWSRPPRTDSDVNREEHVSDQPPAANREIRRSDWSRPRQDSDKNREEHVPERSAPAAPVERPKLQLQPRTVPLASESIVPESARKIFGGALPVDTARREKEIEEKLKHLDSEPNAQDSPPQHPQEDRRHEPSGPDAQSDDDGSFRAKENHSRGQRRDDRPDNERSSRPHAQDMPRPKQIMARSRGPSERSEGSETSGQQQPANEAAAPQQPSPAKPANRQLTPAAPPAENVWEKRKTHTERQPDDGSRHHHAPQHQQQHQQQQQHHHHQRPNESQRNHHQPASGHPPQSRGHGSSGHHNQPSSSVNAWSTGRLQEKLKTDTPEDQENAGPPQRYDDEADDDEQQFTPSRRPKEHASRGEGRGRGGRYGGRGNSHGAGPDGGPRPDSAGERRGGRGGRGRGGRGEGRGEGRPRGDGSAPRGGRRGGRGGQGERWSREDREKRPDSEREPPRQPPTVEEHQPDFNVVNKFSTLAVMEDEDVSEPYASAEDEAEAGPEAAAV